MVSSENDLGDIETINAAIKSVPVYDDTKGNFKMVEKVSFCDPKK